MGWRDHLPKEQAPPPVLPLYAQEKIEAKIRDVLDDAIVIDDAGGDPSEEVAAFWWFNAHTTLGEHQEIDRAVATYNKFQEVWEEFKTDGTYQEIYKKCGEPWETWAKTTALGS